MGGEEYNYTLSELVSAQAIEGNFYVKDLNISGKGLGFGKQGTKKNFVDFIMQEKPDIYVKGGDYNLDTIDQDERRAVESYGGEIKFAKFIEGKSTTKIKDKIKYENE